MVEHGKAGVDFPKEVWPYLDYAGIGAGYYSDHGGAYTPSGYVKRREVIQTQEAAKQPNFALTLASPASTHRLNLPATDDGLEQAKRALRLDDLDSAAIRDVEIDYPWAHLLDMDSITLQDAHILAKCVQEMTAQELRVFGAVLEAEQPNSFSDANLTAMYLDDYELVEDSEREYGREALRKAGADDEILDMLDGFTDFDALGRSIGAPIETQRSGFDGERSRSAVSAPAACGGGRDAEKGKIDLVITKSVSRFKQGIVHYNFKNFLGYRRGEDGEPEIDEEEAPTIRRIFARYLMGQSVGQICCDLTADGCKTARGSTQWSDHTVRHILQNEKYMGDAILQKTFTLDLFSRQRVKNEGQLPKYYVENAHPAIIDRATFQRVQEEMARRSSLRKTSDKAKTEQGKHSGKYALSGLLVCGECGSPYAG